jgi:putative membrane protein
MRNIGSGHNVYLAGIVVSDICNQSCPSLAQSQASGSSGGSGDATFVIPVTFVRIASYAIAAMIATLILCTISARLISFDDAATVLLFGLVVGVINAFVKPVLALLTLPLTCLTFGLFAAILNVALFFFAGYITPGLTMSWWGAIFGALLTGVGSGLMFAVYDDQ